MNLAKKRIEAGHEAMPGDLRRGIEAIIACMRHAADAAHRAADEDSITPAGVLQKGYIKGYADFRDEYRDAVRFQRSGAWHPRYTSQAVDHHFRTEWAEFKEGRSTMSRLIRAALEAIELRDPQGDHGQTTTAYNGAEKRDWLEHITSSASATSRVCAIIVEHDGREHLLRCLALLNINCQNYDLALPYLGSRSQLWPSDDLLCSVISDRHAAIYTVRTSILTLSAVFSIPPILFLPSRLTRLAPCAADSSVFPPPHKMGIDQRW
ncbi:hypothetical protein JCM10296v2_004770 [Rhodotorula toruloides]